MIRRWITILLVVLFHGTFVVFIPQAQEVSSDTASPSSRLDVLDLRNMEILDVLKLISQKSGLNIVAGQNVKGRVNIYLKNVDVMEALRIVLKAYDWAYAMDGEIVMVMTAQEYEQKHGRKFGEEYETKIYPLQYANATQVLTVLNQMKSIQGKIISDDKSNTLILVDTPANIIELEKILKTVDVPVVSQVFELSYAKAEEISLKINELVTPELGLMHFDGRSNLIFVSDTAAKMKSIAAMIASFDKKDTEVLIEAKIVQIGLSDEHKLGIDWEALVSDYHDLELTGDFDILSSTDKAGRVGIGTLTQDNYTAMMEALNTVTETNILSSPRIAAVNNMEAKILVGSTEPYVTSTTTTPSAGPTTTAESVNFIEVGVKLFVTPTIHKDGFITMKIKPEVSSVTSTIKTSNNNSIPVVETSEAETTVMVKDGVTIVIGGLIKEENIETVKRVPLLGGVPFLGAFFRNEDSTISKTEIAIFLTPRIMTGDVPADTAGSGTDL